MSNTNCQIDGCPNKHKARGLCDTHYKAAQRAGTLPPKAGRPTACNVDGCQVKPHARGMCSNHYLDWWEVNGNRKACSVNGCEIPSRLYGMCRKHATRVQRHGDATVTYSFDDEAECVRFILSMIAVRATDQCWEYQGAKHTNGYGRHSNLYAHRVSYAYWHPNTGAIGDGLMVRHSCDNPPCCNPHHLSLGTALDNNRDMHERGRASVGESCGAAKLTEAAVRQIRASAETSARLAEIYGVSPGAISRAREGRTWAHVV